MSRLKVLQRMSPELLEHHHSHVPRARPGDVIRLLADKTTEFVTMPIQITVTDMEQVPIKMGHIAGDRWRKAVPFVSFRTSNDNFFLVSRPMLQSGRENSWKEG